MAAYTYSTSSDDLHVPVVNRRTAMAGIAALAATTAAPANAAPAGVSPRLLELIAAHKAAWAAEDDAVNAQDQVWCEQNGVPHTQEAVDIWRDAMHASDRALRAVIHFRCRTGADRYMKADYLFQRVGRFGSATLGCDEDFGLMALLRSMREEGRIGA